MTGFFLAGIMCLALVTAAGLYFHDSGKEIDGKLSTVSYPTSAQVDSHRVTPIINISQRANDYRVILDN